MFIVFIFQRYSVHFVDLGLYPSLSDFKLSSFWDDPSTLWTLVYIRPFWTLNFHPSGMIRPLCGLWLISVRFGPQIFILLGRFVHFMDLLYIRPFWTSNFHPFGMIRPLCGLVVYPSILDFTFSSSWDDPSTLWTCCISVHFGLQILILLGLFVHIVDLFYIRPLWTSNFHPPGMIRSHCGLVVFVYVIFTHLSDPSTLWTPCNLSIHNKIHVENQSCIWIFLLKENVFVEKSTCPFGLKKA